MQHSFLELSDNKKLAYVLSEGKLPCVIFFGGFKSDMTGTKATALEELCKKNGQRFIRFDYSGHGKSSGRFEDGTIGEWKQDALAIIDKLGAEKNILVGSSMGAWVALLCALERKEKTSAFVGIASAPDFTENLIWNKLNDEQKTQLRSDGVYHAPSCYGDDPYPITLKLIEEARNHLLLSKTIDLNIPIRLIHGTKDQDVPYATSKTLADRITGKDKKITLIEGGDHRLSEPQQLDIICKSVQELCKSTQKGKG